MFDTLIDTITSIVGVTILIFVGVIIVSLFFKSTVAKHIVKLVGILVYIFFILGCIFFKHTIEISFTITFICSLCLLAIIALIYFIRETGRISAIANHQAELEEKCRTCEHFEECENCYNPNCQDYTPEADEM